MVTRERAGFIRETPEAAGWETSGTFAQIGPDHRQDHGINVGGAPTARGSRIQPGTLDEHAVVISPPGTCDLITAFVDHKWMHVQQGHE
jgi:hypothetical protein